MRRLALPVAAFAVIVSASACGGSSNNPPAGSIVVKLSEFKFDPNTISHAHGKITFFLENNGTSAHDMFIYDAAGNNEIAGSELVQPGNDSEFTVNMPTPGSYPFKCTQPGHAAAGMTGTLTIT
ncbi:MAG TPA: plastocyanin/azurin family copper-binding protein [Candidatus Dormibacteraeota bacterium]